MTPHSYIIVSLGFLVALVATLPITVHYLREVDRPDQTLELLLDIQQVILSQEAKITKRYYIPHTITITNGTIFLSKPLLLRTPVLKQVSPFLFEAPIIVKRTITLSGLVKVSIEKIGKTVRVSLTD